MKCPRSPLIAFCFSKLGRHSCSINKQTPKTIEQLPTMSKERERPSGKVFVTFRVCKKHCSNVQSSRYLILPLSLSHLMNGAIGRRPAAAKVQSVSSQCKLRLLPRLICTSYPTARHNNSAIQCNNSSVAGKGIWVTGFL